MSMMVSFVLSFFPRDVLDEILNLIESVSEDFPSYSSMQKFFKKIYVCVIYVFLTLRLRDSPSCFLLFYQRGKICNICFAALRPSTTLIG